MTHNSVLCLLAMLFQSCCGLTTTNAFMQREVPRETFTNLQELQTKKLSQCAIKCRQLQGGCSALKYSDDDGLCVLGDFLDSIMIGNPGETTNIYLMDDFIKWGEINFLL